MLRLEWQVTDFSKLNFNSRTRLQGGQYPNRYCAEAQGGHV